MPNEEFLTTDALAELTHTKSQTWRLRRMRGDGPRYVKHGNRVMYRWSDVERWLNERTRQSTAAVATPGA